MLARLRQRLLPARRLGTLLLVLVFLVHPVLMVAAELHEASHTHAAGHASHASHAAPTEVPAPDGGELWHGLMHNLHCCGAFSLLPSVAPTVLALPLPNAAPGSTTPALRSLALPEPLRPPIHG
jgi:hypothetical protein